MNNSIWYKRIPTLFGLLLLIGGIFGVNWAISHGVFFESQASPTYAPENIRITNITDISFTVSYTTKEQVLGTLSYGTSTGEGKVALDDRDQASGNPQPYFVHHITLKSLTAQTQYYYSIVSSDKIFLDDNKPFTTTTLTPLSQNPSQQQPIIGAVSHANGDKDNNVIVFLVSDNAQILSVLTHPDGTFVMPLNAIRSKDLSTYLTLTPQSVIKLLAQGTDAQAKASVFASQISPVPPLVLGNSYDFTTSSSISPQPVASGSADTAFPSFSATEANDDKPQIITPDNKEAFHDAQPEFEGTALPSSSVQIEIHSDTPITTSVTANKNGSWSYRPTTRLSPGEHTITIKTKDKNGILQTITRSFTVFAEGSQFTEPSVSPQQVTPTVSPTPTRIPSPSPTNSPTPPITLSPTFTPTPTTAMPPSGILTQSVAPVTQSPGSSLVFLSGIIATIMLGTGALLILLAKGSSL